MLKNKFNLLIDYIKRNRYNILLVILNIIIIVICFILLNKIILLGFKVKGIKSIMSFMGPEDEKLKKEWDSLVSGKSYETIIFGMLMLYGLYSVSKTIFYYLYADQLKLFSEFVAFQEHLEKNKENLNVITQFEEYQKYKDTEFQEFLNKKNPK
jgi:hypothetical protein